MNDPHSTFYALTNAQLPGGDGSSPLPSDNTIIVKGKQISAVCPASRIPEDCRSIDLKGANVAPGFIDLQLNGCGGVLFNDDISAATLDRMHLTNLQSGCTAFLPTLITSDDASIRKAVEVARDYCKQFPERVPGLHLEGPYINPVRKGIHNPACIRQPSGAMVDFIAENADIVKIITLAPEICPEGTIEQLSEAGIVVSLGHTDANCAQVKAAEKAGARFITHLFNAMSQITGREPGVVGAVFDSDVLAAGIIADGYHVAWENIRTACKLLQDRLVLVTDATPAVGSQLAEFEFGGHRVFHRNGKCVNEDGTLGGSALTMDQAIRNCLQQGISLETAINMATLYAARAIGKADVMGGLTEGHYANLVILDKDFSVTGTVSGGDIQFAHDTTAGT